MSESITLKELTGLLDDRLDPMREAIGKLEKNQEKIVTILTEQARQQETIRHIETELDRRERTIDGLFARIRGLEDQSSNRLWDVSKIVLTAVVSSSVGAGAIALLGG